MKTSRIGRFKILAVLGLALAALVLVLSLGDAGGRTAQAEDPVDGELSLNVKVNGTCDDPSKPTKCDVPIGEAFTLSVSVNQFPTAWNPDGYTGVQAVVGYDPALTFKNAAITAAHPCGTLLGMSDVSNYLTIACTTIIFFPLPSSNPTTQLGNVFELEFNCSAEAATGLKLAMPTEADQTHPGSYLQRALLGDPPVYAKLATQDQGGVPVADTLTINCVEPEGQINITKVDAISGAPLADACFGVADAVGTPLFGVCDNDFQAPPSPSPVCVPDGVCEDEDPAAGSIRVTVDAATYWVLETKAPPGYKPDPNAQACTVPGGAKCEIIVQNAPAPDEVINIHVNNKNGTKQEGTCWRVFYDDPVAGKVVHDVVGDNVGGVKPDCGEPSNLKLSDSDEAGGLLSITITSAQRVQLGNIWHVQMSFSPVGDPVANNYVCDLSQGPCTVPKVAVGGLQTALDPTGSGGSAGLLGGIIAGISAAAIALGGAAWYARRRWLA